PRPRATVSATSSSQVSPAPARTVAGSSPYATSRLRTATTTIGRSPPPTTRVEPPPSTSTGTPAPSRLPTARETASGVAHSSSARGRPPRRRAVSSPSGAPAATVRPGTSERAAGRPASAAGGPAAGAPDGGPEGDDPGAGEFTASSVTGPCTVPAMPTRFSPSTRIGARLEVVHATLADEAFWVDRLRTVGSPADTLD